MADIYVDVDTAIVVPMNDMPLVDDTDFKTLETALVYNSAGIKVYWHFVTTAGVYTITEIHPTTAGVHDISEPIADIGHYGIEIPASGGSHANNDAEGVGWITGLATGIYHFKGPKVMCRAAALNNRDVDNTSDVIATAIADIHDTDLPAVKTETAAIKAKTDNLPASPAAVGSNMGSVSSVTAGVTVTTNNDKTGYALTTAPPTAAEVKTAVEAAGSHLALIKAKTDNLPADTNTLLVTTGIKAASIPAVSGVTLHADYDHAKDDVLTPLAVVDGNVDSILADTGELQTDWKNGGRLDLILDAASAPSASDNASAVRTELAAELAKITSVHDTDLPAVKADTDSILNNRLTLLRAGYLDNLSGGEVSTAHAVSVLQSDMDLVKGDTSSMSTAITLLNDISLTDVDTVVDNALGTYDAPTKAEMDSALSAAIASLATQATLLGVKNMIEADVTVDTIAKTITWKNASTGATLLVKTYDDEGTTQGIS